MQKIEKILDMDGDKFAIIPYYFISPDFVNLFEVWAVIESKNEGWPIVLRAKPVESEFRKLIEKWHKQGAVFGIKIKE